MASYPIRQRFITSGVSYRCWFLPIAVQEVKVELVEFHCRLLLFSISIGNSVETYMLTFGLKGSMYTAYEFKLSHMVPCIWISELCFSNFLTSLLGGCRLPCLQTLLLFMCITWRFQARPWYFAFENQECFLRKQGHRQPCFYSEARILSTQLGHHHWHHHWLLS